MHDYFILTHQEEMPEIEMCDSSQELLPEALITSLLSNKVVIGYV